MATKQEIKTEEMKQETKQSKQYRSALEVYNDIENALVELELIPDLIQILISEYGLDSTIMNEAETFHLVHGYKGIHSTLRIIQRTIWDMVREVQEISLHE